MSYEDVKKQVTLIEEHEQRLKDMRAISSARVSHVHIGRKGDDYGVVCLEDYPVPIQTAIEFLLDAAVTEELKVVEKLKHRFEDEPDDEDDDEEDF